MSGAIHPLPQYTFMAWCLVKAQGQLYLYLKLSSCVALVSITDDATSKKINI
jgi:hypothetical protein